MRIFNYYYLIFIHTKNEEDSLHKSELVEIFKTKNKSLSQRHITYELKKIGIKYKKDKMKDGKRGFFVGLKLVEEEFESDND